MAPFKIILIQSFSRVSISSVDQNAGQEVYIQRRLELTSKWI